MPPLPPGQLPPPEYLYQLRRTPQALRFQSNLPEPWHQKIRMENSFLYLFLPNSRLKIQSKALLLILGLACVHRFLITAFVYISRIITTYLYSLSTKSPWLSLSGAHPPSAPYRRRPSYLCSHSL